MGETETPAFSHQNGFDSPPRVSVTPLTRPKNQSVYVSIPGLSKAEKAKYEPLIPELDERIKVDEVVGEVFDDIKGPLYYGRYKDGMIRGFPAEAFALNYPELVASYEAKKDEGSLKPFDPQGTGVHPNWRISFTLSIDKKRRRASVSASSAHGSHGGESEIPDTEGTSDDHYSEGNRNTRRSARQKQISKLPFSPRKTRSTAVYPVLDSDDEEELPLAPRRSLRNRPISILLDEDDLSFSNSTESDEYVASGKSITNRPKNNGKGKGRGTRKPYTGTIPEYGLFRSVEEINEDPDPDTRELREHWTSCGKCHSRPAHELIKRESSKKGKARKRTSDDDLDGAENETERLEALGGWVQCLKCPVSMHWACLSRASQDEILKATRERDRVEWLKTNESGAPDLENGGPRKRPGLIFDQMTNFICRYCVKESLCMGCLAVIPAQSIHSNEPSDKEHSRDHEEDVEMKEVSSMLHSPPIAIGVMQLFFRCFTCKRLAHYQHIEDDITDDDDLATIAHHYQLNWLCGNCSSYQWRLDKILAWRPYPANAIQPHPPVNTKEPLPREYLVKWQERSYRRTDWVPHMWLVSTHPSKLKFFITHGTKVELLGKTLDQPQDDQPSSLFDGQDDSTLRQLNTDHDSLSALSPLVDAEDKIPIAWQTIDRVLDIQLRFIPRKKDAKQNRKAKRRGKMRIQSEEDESEPEDATNAFRAAFDKGEEPLGFVESVDEFEARTGINFDPDEHAGLVVWAFLKWVDLGYEDSTWDAPPQSTDPTYPVYLEALKRFAVAREVHIERLNKQKLEAFLNRDKSRRKTIKSADDLALGQDSSLRLMPFQVEGFNWLCENWWNQQPCILADEMGLVGGPVSRYKSSVHHLPQGKTVQIASFIGHIVKNMNAMPALVVVPNSTITNWVREFERWTPNLRVVPFYGEAKAREVIKKFELRHSKVSQGTTGAKFHVLVTTYESITNPKEFGNVFKNQPRWEVRAFVVFSEDLYLRLPDISYWLSTKDNGTPLNNNIRELFNLMNFLDPAEWNDLPALEEHYADLNEDLIKELHTRLRPYFLRRIKSEVLDLPPKNEVIVPVSMSSLQREVYRSILSRNLELLQGLMKPTGPNSHTRKATINNTLMQLRKCLQHPYLYENIEPQGLSAEETHENLISASTKLRLLRDLLPKLKRRGHRVLIFSQFVLALNVIEDFLLGEGHKFLRLDGSTRGSDRQKGMDEFNRPGSDVFIYLLTTRAGGVGINLFTADTVVIFDPDFNPHQDLQAIARAHRFGQKKTCLVFKLMVKDSAEERIMQIGKKKLVLDHLIVQKMDDDESAGENVQSILTYGALQLFDGTDENAKHIVYTETDIDNLIAKTEREGDQDEIHKEGNAFSFAKIWTAEKDELEEIADDGQAVVDSWAQTLQKINEEMTRKQAQEEEESAKAGRHHARRKTTTIINYALDFDSPNKHFEKNSDKSGASDLDSSQYSDFGRRSGISSDFGSEADASDENERPSAPLEKNKKGKAKANPQVSMNTGPQACGLCGQLHGSNNCPMTESSENLVEYREMLIMYTQDESYEHRCSAVNAIDEVLNRRGHIKMILGQPLYPVKASRRKSPTNIPKNSSRNHLPTAGMQASTFPAPVVNEISRVLRFGVAKRLSSPSPSEPSLKKPKQQKDTVHRVRDPGQTLHKYGLRTA
ncbi:hypothetical protein D9757_004581 [Collybiopsis confluens]|uniref:Chromatin remodeling factor mit1 n=1 Tax=Collybiopsis confluens TaxID=2823264 RepID=A0A8H5HS40_9AGAR|nr:hypothetical protein D9757_004581 [Collybiopsis confluens]